jgi:uncharacterized coiled-coil protein SlyX
MMTTASSWLRENSTLMYFLAAQMFALITAGAYGLSYMVRLEGRVNTLETRGSSHLEQINTRLTVTEKETESNNKRLQRIVEIMTRELHIAPSRLPP